MKIRIKQVLTEGFLLEYIVWHSCKNHVIENINKEELDIVAEEVEYRIINVASIYCITKIPVYYCN